MCSFLLALLFILKSRLGTTPSLVELLIVNKPINSYIRFPGPLTEFGPDAHAYFNVNEKNKLWPDIGFILYTLPFVSAKVYPNYDSW